MFKAFIAATLNHFYIIMSSSWIMSWLWRRRAKADRFATNNLFKPMALDDWSQKMKCPHHLIIKTFQVIYLNPWLLILTMMPSSFNYKNVSSYLFKSMTSHANNVNLPGKNGLLQLISKSILSLLWGIKNCSRFKH